MRDLEYYEQRLEQEIAENKRLRKKLEFAENVILENSGTSLDDWMKESKDFESEVMA